MPIIEESFGHWIARLYRSSQTYVATKLAAYGIGRGQHSYMLLLYQQDGITQDYISKALYTDKASVTRALVRLERRGYIERRKDTNDGRNKSVYLTDKARNVKSQVLSVVTSLTYALAEGFSDQEKQQTITMLKHMAENASRAVEKDKKKSL